MEKHASRARSAGSRGRGRYQSENPHQNRNPWQNSPQNRQYRETGGPQSGAPRAANPNREVAADHSAQPRSDSSQNWRQDRPSVEAGAAQWGPPRAAGHVENFGQGRSFLDAAMSQSSGSGGNGGDGRRGGGGGGTGRGGGGGAQSVPRQSSVEPAAATTTAAYMSPSLELEKLKISDPPSRSGSIVPIKRPDNGGKAGIRTLQLLVNHFPISFDPRMKIYQYNLDIHRVTPDKPNAATAKILKGEARLVKERLFAKFPTLFPTLNTAYDGERNIYSAVELQQCGKFSVEVSKGDDVTPREYVVAVKLVALHDLNTLSEYFNRTVTCNPREILQALDVVMRENPSLSRIPFGRYFFSKGIDRDLGEGIIASRGFHQSLKPTAQGLSICMDYTVISFRKQVPVLEFLRQHLGVVIDVNMSWTPDQRKDVEEVLKGLKVTVNHRRTSQKYEVVGLTRDNTNNVKFDHSGTDSKGVVFIVDHFRVKYGKEVVYKRIPCLDLSKNKRVNYVPMEFCELVEGQRYPKESLRGDVAKVLKDMALIKPAMRKDWICRMIGASDGPSGGGIANQFHIAVNNNMTEVTGRVLKQPNLKIRNSNDQCCGYTPGEDGQWNLLKHKVYKGNIVDKWAILDFTTKSNRWYQLNVQQFNQNIVERANRVGIPMNPQFLFYESSSFRILENEKQLYNTLKRICGRAEGKLQLLFCPMEKRHPSYNTLKRICETELGIVTQCFLTPLKDQYYVNLALKINTKLGGSNMELFDSLPCLDDNCPVMFMGADVNHPSSRSLSGISIAAVTASMNWPGANQYAFRICAQPRRTEKILDIGDMCLDLIKTYVQKNGIKPEKIIFFRDGVSDGQFDMVLNEELIAIKKAIEMDGYRPTITLVVAQKRHQTRFFPKNPRDAGKTGNIPPGTVVDNTVIHLDEYDFYLCSHNGTLGTSKPTHYHVLFDEHQFSSDDLQRIIYNLCYTFPRCTKPISLVPPVLCADLAAYRGRQYDDSTMHSPTSSASSSSGSSSTSSSMASIEINNFPKVHADLQNQMIFL